MSHIERIVGQLRVLMNGVDRAQGLAAAADDQAREVALRAAGAGFAAVAAGTARVRQEITGIRESLTGLATSVGEATTAAMAVPQEATPQQTITVLTPVRNTVDGARDAAAGAIARADEARRLTAVVLQGGQPGPLLSALSSIKQFLVLVVQRAGSARQFVEAAIVDARRLGASGN
ncbi:DUF6244 family protein [Micromonospora sp. NPDC047730]|uniref:DUF6244 family protein n=1 Tax=Micromonospora sp. NPDC047730 TaxID=3364253 RepID=UPI00371206F5